MTWRPIETAPRDGTREDEWRIAQLIGHSSMANARDDFFPPFGVGSRSDKAIPHYTTSLDAALTLLPGDWRGEHLGESQLNFNMWECELHNRNEDDAIQGDAITPALALCIAALKARS